MRAPRWSVSFEDSGKLRDRERHSGDEDTGSECARGDWCCGSVIVRQPDGTMKRTPARSPRPYCDACRSRIGACLADLPEAFARLQAGIGERPVTGKAVRVPPGPRLLLRADIDALMRDMASVLASWHKRVATIAALSVPDTEQSRRSLGRTVSRAVLVLHAHLDALLALAAEPMARVMPPRLAAARMTTGDAYGIVRPSGEAHMLLPLSGTDAGAEILDLHRRARSILGETRPRPETFDGIPCRECEDMALERAEPPSDPDAEAMHSRCASCGDAMNRAEFGEWARRYAKWAESADLPACRRCQDSRHDECAWKACPCANSGHTTTLAA